jgi:hypothetical protein
MGNVRGKSTKALTVDIAEGYVAVNPLFLKPFDAESLKDFYHQIDKTQKELRAERFPSKDVQAIRMRNLKLQRLYAAQMVIRNFARERRILIL